MIYLTGDIHGGKRLPDRLKDCNYLTEKDILIVLGDFGLIFAPEQTEEEDYWLRWLANKPWKTLFLDGNHENHVRLNEYPEVICYGSAAREIIENKIYYLERGNVYTIEDKKIFIMGGATSIDSYLRTMYVDWWPEENISSADMTNAYFNLERCNFKVDYVLTHAAPEDIAEIVLKNGLNVTNIYDDPNAKALSVILSDIKFKKWYFGHYHIDYKVNNLFQCLYTSIIKLGD